MTLDYDIAALLVAIFTNLPIYHLQPEIIQLCSILTAFGFPNLWHGILPQQLSQIIFNKGHGGKKWTQKLILLILCLHNNLW